MKIGLVTDSLSHLDFDTLLKYCAELGVDCIELCVGNWGAAAHIEDRAALIESAPKRRELLAKVRDHGLEISAFTANGNQLHPTDGARQNQTVEQAIQLASLCKVERVVVMSGLPGGAPEDRMPNWIVTSWPPETQDALRYQWEDVTIPYWQNLAKFANAHGIHKLCIEAHGNQIVHNMPTFMRLREAVGETVGLNFDPSHFMWMGGDPIEMIKHYSECIYHVHAKDTALDTHNMALNTCLDSQPMAHQLARSWSYVTLGYGKDEHWWRAFCYQLQARGYDDGVLSIEHEDMQLSRKEGVRRSVELLKRVMPVEQADYCLP